MSLVPYTLDQFNEILKIKDDSFVDTIERVHVNDITVDEFIEKYERGHKPVII